MPALSINGKVTVVDADEPTPIFWALRDRQGMTGTNPA
jgi:aerobic-type carbon monoxide dehydrogenase small subunit (CoxS/CutS family)